MGLIGLPLELIILCGCVMWASSALIYAFASFVAIRRQFAGFSKLLIDFALVISNGLMMVGAGISIPYFILLLLRIFDFSLYEEMVIVIYFLAVLAGLLVGAVGGAIIRNIAYKFAGEPVKSINVSQFFRFGKSAANTRQSFAHSSRFTADERFIIANKMAWILLAFVAAACLWRNSPNSVLVVVSCFVAAATGIAIRFDPKLLSPETMKSNANSGLFFLCISSPLGLALKAMYRFELLDWQWPLIAAALFGLPIAYLLLRSMGGVSGGRVGTAFLAVYFCFSGPGSLVWAGVQFANGLGMPDVVAIKQVQISSMHVQRGKYDTMYWINSAEPVGLNGVENIKLDRQTYGRLSVGDKACIEIRRGTFSLRWYKVTACAAVKIREST